MSYDAQDFGDGLVGFTLPESAITETECTPGDTAAAPNGKPATQRRTTKATKSKS